MIVVFQSSYLGLFSDTQTKYWHSSTGTLVHYQCAEMTMRLVLMRTNTSPVLKDVLNPPPSCFQPKVSLTSGRWRTAPSRCGRGRACPWWSTWRPTLSPATSPGTSWARSWPTPPTMWSPPTTNHTGEPNAHRKLSLRAQDQCMYTSTQVSNPCRYVQRHRGARPYRYAPTQVGFSAPFTSDMF